MALTTVEMTIAGDSSAAVAALRELIAALPAVPEAPLAEVTIAWGDDTHCTGCAHPLPAESTAYVSADWETRLCVSCAERDAAAIDRLAADLNEGN